MTFSTASLFSFYLTCDYDGYPLCRPPFKGDDSRGAIEANKPTHHQKGLLTRLRRVHVSLWRMLLVARVLLCRV